LGKVERSSQANFPMGMLAVSLSTNQMLEPGRVIAPRTIYVRDVDRLALDFLLRVRPLVAKR